MSSPLAAVCICNPPHACHQETIQLVASATSWCRPCPDRNAFRPREIRASARPLYRATLRGKSTIGGPCGKRQGLAVQPSAKGHLGRNRRAIRSRAGHGQTSRLSSKAPCANGCNTRPRRSRWFSASASSFMCATISTSPDLTSVTTAVISPLPSNFGVKARPSSMSCAADDKAGSCLSPSP